MFAVVSTGSAAAQLSFVVLVASQTVSLTPHFLLVVVAFLC